MPAIHASLDMTACEDAMTVKYVAPHGSVVEGYYRLSFPHNLTVYLSPKQVDALAFILRNPD